MGLLHHRRQHAVGQGCFHSASVSSFVEITRPDQTIPPGVQYVYDCGALRTYARALQSAVDAYQAGLQRRTIDFLFLSHLHEDHVSGLKALCGPGTGVSVDTIVMPLLDVVDRLICFARAVEVEPDDVDPFLADLAADPASALAQLEPRQIIFVRSGGRGAPGPGEGVDPPEHGPFDNPDIRTDLKWRLTRSGEPLRDARAPDVDGDAIIARPTGAIPVFEIDDGAAFVVTSRGADVEWILAPYVDPAIIAGRQRFVRAVVAGLGLSMAVFRQRIQDAAWLRDRLIADRAVFVRAYGLLAENLNVTSLSLYSGPYRARGKRTFHGRFGAVSYHAALDDTQSVGWFGTGDADLRTAARRDAFLDHYRHYLTTAITILLPHHGSDHNLSPSVLDAFTAQFFIAAADRFRNWRHPGSQVVQAVSSRGWAARVVTSDPRSEICEWATVSS